MLRLKKISSNSSRSTKLRIKKKAELQASILLEEAFSKHKSNNNSQLNNISIPILETQNKSYNYIPAIVHKNDNIEKNTEQKIIEKNNSDESSNDDLCDMIESNLKVSFQDLIAGWALKNYVPHLILNELLKILKSSGHPDICADSRTLLKTPHLTVSRNIPGGQYIHFSLTSEIVRILNDSKLSNKIPKTLQLMVGIDGLPISRSTQSEIWPILGYFSNIPDKQVFAIGAFHGQSKPKDCNDFLHDFVKEIIPLINDGIVYNNKHVKILLHGIICDAPAKSFVLNTLGHTGKVSCSKCTIEGIWLSKACFPIIDAPLRTDESFRKKEDSKYHNGPTILVNIPKFSIVESCIIDYMHLICEGVVLKIVNLWITGANKNPTKLPDNLIQVVNKRLNHLAKYIPLEFQRKQTENSRMHPFSQASRWKATESRQFLLYTSIICIKGVVSDDIYNNFIVLCVAIRILLSPSMHKTFNDYADQLLRYFVSTFRTLYGIQHMTYNIHGLIHLAKEALKYGELDQCSAFPFESFMQPLKKDIRSPVKPLQQLARRYMERRNFYDKIALTERDISDENQSNGDVKLLGKAIFENGGPLTSTTNYPQYKRVKITNFTIGTNRQDCCVQMDNNDIVIIESIATSTFNDSEVVIVGRKYKTLCNIFESPCESKFLDIYSVSNLEMLNVWPLSRIKKKMVCFKSNPSHSQNTDVVMPLIHHT